MTTPPPGAGWNGRDPDSGWSTGPLYDDTGWHIDLSDVDPDDDAERGVPAGPDRPGNTPFPYRSHHDGNGFAPDDSGFDWLTPRQQPPAARPAGRHARHARPDELSDGYQPAPPVAPASPANTASPEPAPGEPGYPNWPSRFGQPDPASPLAQYSYPESGGPARSGQPKYPDPAQYSDPASPLAEYSYPEPGSAYPEPGGPYPEPGGPYAEPGDPYAEPGGPYAEPGRSYPEPRSPQHAGPPAYADPHALAAEADRDGQSAPAPRLELTRPLLPAPPESIEAAPAGGAVEVVETGQASVLRSSGVMAIGTLGSRVTGFLRTIAQSYALGVLGIATAYNLSNTLPNVVYNLALGGILTSVIVPLIVNAKKRDPSSGGAYEQRMFTLVTAALLGVTVVATAAAVPIVLVYSGVAVTRHPAELHLAVIFAYFFIPQIFFYGLSSLIGAVLNTRNSFAAPMWTPIINNFVVIGVLALYVAVAGLHRDPATISGAQVQLLGLGTTLGIVAQTVALLPALRRVGFRWQPRTDFRRAEVTEIGRMAGWMFGYIAATQIAFLVTTKIATDTSSGVTDYNYAWLLFQLPYAVVGISVITALLPRMSAHASEGRLSLVRDDFSAGIRLASVIVVPCSLVLAVLGPALAEIFLAHGATTPADAHYMGVVFAVFCLGLLPYMVFQLQLRVFYSLHDSKTPALIGAVTMTLNIMANVIALHVLSKGDLVAGLGVGFGLANLLGTAIAWRILDRRLGGLGGQSIGSTVGRMHVAAVPAALLALLVTLIVGNVITGSRSAAAVSIVLGGGGALLVYLLFARALRIGELTSVTSMLMRRLGR